MTPETFSKIGRIYRKTIEGIAAAIIVLVALAMLEMVVSRAVFHFPWSALDRINTIAMIWACFLVAGLLVETEGHIAVTYLPTKLSGLRLAFLKLFIHLALLATFVLVAYYAFFAFKAVYETGIFYPAEVDIPQWLNRLPIFLGMALGVPLVLNILIANVIYICRQLKGRNRS